MDVMKWWEDARFGMFIHWGIYAVPAGTWKGERIKGLGEWIRHDGQIPAAQYAAIAQEFNPVRFNAEEWVAVAKRAGMKYMVITAKHHDGFAMFDSPCDPFNIVAATPYAKDPMKPLAEACRKAGLKLGFYYSQTQDWHHPGGAGHWEEGGDWHHSRPDPAAFQNYLDAKVKPQLRELLTQYGPVGLIWFDTPVGITPEQSVDLKCFVKSLQPDCLVSGRIGNQVGDYASMGDNMIPIGRVAGHWETPATLNDTWGFKSYDDNWKDAGELLHLLSDLAGKGVNYLLNVGPTAAGIIPPESVKLLESIGRWMDVNGDAIYGTHAGPFPTAFPWGTMTQKAGKLYLLITQWPGRKLLIPGIRTRVRSASLPAAPGVKVGVAQTDDRALDMPLLELTLSAEAPDPHVSVVRLDLDGPVEVDETPTQQNDGGVTLPAVLAAVQNRESLKFGDNGITRDWLTTAPVLSWRFKIARPGRFRVEIISRRQSESDGTEGNEVELRIDDTPLRGPLSLDRVENSARARHVPEKVSSLGEIHLATPGEHNAALRATTLKESKIGIRIAEVRLTPAAI